MPFNTEIIAASGLGIALAACCGFRVFIPMLIAGLAGKFGLFQFAESFTLLSSTPALISLGVASAFEIGAYYIPFVDNILDTIATPMSIVAGTILATSVFPIDNEWMKWIMGILAGGGSAGMISAGTGILRLFTTKLTLGAGNPVISTSENAAAIGGSLLSFTLPIIMAVLFLVVFFWLIVKFGKKLFSFSKTPNSTAV